MTTPSCTVATIPQCASQIRQKVIRSSAGMRRDQLGQPLRAILGHVHVRVVDELERRGWSPGDAAVAVLPHLLPKLPPEEVDAILAGLREIGLSEEDIARLSTRG